MSHAFRELQSVGTEIQNTYLADERHFKGTIDNGYEYVFAIHLSLIFIVG